MKASSNPSFEQALRDSCARLQAQFASFQQQNALTISVLESLVSANQWNDDLEDQCRDAIDQIASVLGAEVANCFADDETQEMAISAAERWASSNFEFNPALILWHQGVETGKKSIADSLGPKLVRTDREGG